MTSDLVAPTLQDRSRRSLQRIVSTAEMVLRREGIEGFSIATIADASGISVGGIYARVKGKSELYQLVKEGAVQKVHDVTVKKLRGRHASAASVIDAFIDAHVATFSRDERLHRALFTQGVVQRELSARGATARKSTIDVFVETLIGVEPALASQDRRWLNFGGEMVVRMILAKLNTDYADLIDWETLQAQLRVASAAYYAALLPPK